MNGWIIIISEGSATDFDTALCAYWDTRAARSPDIALQQEDERATQGPRKRHKFAARRSSCCGAGKAHPPVLPGCGERVTISGNERRWTKIRTNYRQVPVRNSPSA
jgi:hypothetical protein